MPADYRGTTAKDLYYYCSAWVAWKWTQEANAAACAWVEAENAAAVFAVILDWFQAMQGGVAKDRYPDPDWRGEPMTPEIADRLIEELDADFGKEYHRFPHVKDSDGNTVVEAKGPEFSRLPPHARLAFAQEIRGVLKTETEIVAETIERLAKGEKLPPWTGGQEAPEPRGNPNDPGYGPD